jgi:hypothetical protein
VAKKKTTTKSPARTPSVKKKSTKRNSSPRELIDTGRDKRYVRRDRAGRFNGSDDVGKSLAQDQRRKAKHTAKRGQGDQGDRKRS